MCCATFERCQSYGHEKSVFHLVSSVAQNGFTFRASKSATVPAANRPARNFRCARGSAAASDGRWRRSCGAPAGFCLQSIPAQSSNPARFCGNGWAGRAAGIFTVAASVLAPLCLVRSRPTDAARRGLRTLPPAAAPESTRGRATFSGLESKRRVPVFSKLPASGCVRPAPNTRVRGRGAGCSRRSFHSGSSLNSSRPSESASSRPMG